MSSFSFKNVVFYIQVLVNLICVRNFGKNNSFEFKQKITGQTGNGGAKDVETMVLLKHLSKVCRTLEIPLINCEITLQLTYSENVF